MRLALATIALLATAAPALAQAPVADAVVSEAEYALEGIEEGGFTTHELTLTAGFGERCVRVGDDESGLVPSASRPGHLRPSTAAHAEPSVRTLYPGGELCGWADLMAPSYDETFWLRSQPSSSAPAPRIHLRIVSVRGYLIATLAALFLMSFLLLFLALQPPPSPAPAQLAWTRQARGGYRDGESLEWTLSPIPEVETALADLDEGLSGLAHTITQTPEEIEFVAASAVVVSPPPPFEPSVQVADMRLERGTQILDGEHRIAILSAATAARLARGEPLAEPDRAAVVRARRAGLSGELGAHPVPKPSTPRRVGVSLVLAGVAAALPWTLAAWVAGTYASAPAGSLAFAAGLLFALVSVVWIARLERRRLRPRSARR